MDAEDPRPANIHPVVLTSVPSVSYPLASSSDWPDEDEDPRDNENLAEGARLHRK